MGPFNDADPVATTLFERAGPYFDEAPSSIWAVKVSALDDATRGQQLSGSGKALGSGDDKDSPKGQANHAKFPCLTMS
jgi:hypothetical protein